MPQSFILIQNFEKCFKFDPNKICLNYFSWMNSIQALYHFPSLGTAVDFSIVRLEIHKTQVIFRLSFLSFIVKIQSLLKHELSANLNGWCVSLQVYRLSNGFAKIWVSHILEIKICSEVWFYYTYFYTFILFSSVRIKIYKIQEMKTCEEYKKIRVRLQRFL